MIKRLTYISLLLVTALSCVYPYDVTLESSDEFIPVIDGVITIGDKATVKVSKMLDLNSDYYGNTLPAIAFSWWVEDDKGTIYTPSSSKPEEINMSVAPFNRQYRMHVEVDGKTYESSWQTAPDPPTIKDITFWANDYTVFFGVTVNENEESGTGFMAFTFEETWEFHVDYIPDYDIDPETWSFKNIMQEDEKPGNYYCWANNNSNSYVVADLSNVNGKANSLVVQSFPRTNNRNHKKYSIKVNAHTITENEYRFRSNLQSNKEGGNDLFTPNPGEMAGNITCTNDDTQRVFGYVTMSRADSKRVYLDNRYLIAPEINDAYLTIVPREEYKSYYDSGYRPIKESVDFEGNMGIGWGPLRCMDCTYAGGTLVKPDFWEGDDHNKPGEAEL